MRVTIEAPDGTEMKGLIVGGEIFNERLDYCDLTKMFTLRSDEGGFFFVQGWQVRINLADATIQ